MKSHVEPGVRTECVIANKKSAVINCRWPGENIVGKEKLSHRFESGGLK
jgi:hypothetical protein